jgi:hypothetical protein
MNLFGTRYSHEDHGRAFEPDVIAAAQFYASCKPARLRDPERRLMAAILEDAVSCLSMDPRRGTSRQRKQFEEARRWIDCDDDSEWIFSFQNVCEVLGLDPSYLRRGLSKSAGTRVIAPERRRPGKRPAAHSYKTLRLRTGS